MMNDRNGIKFFLLVLVTALFGIWLCPHDIFASSQELTDSNSIIKNIENTSSDIKSSRIEILEKMNHLDEGTR